MENEVKEPAPKYNFVSAEAYLEMERAAQEKHEYYKGKLFAMSGASLAHNQIVKNVNTLILPFLKDKHCDMFGSHLHIHIPLNTLYTYPDLSIICGNPETTDSSKDTVTNPTVIIEILSDSTKDNDRGTKFNLYRSIKTLKEYILIDSTAISVEHFSRQGNNTWNLKEFKQLSESFVISTISLTILLKDIYEDMQIDQ